MSNSAFSRCAGLRALTKAGYVGLRFCKRDQPGISSRLIPPTSLRVRTLFSTARHLSRFEKECQAQNMPSSKKSARLDNACDFVLSCAPMLIKILVASCVSCESGKETVCLLDARDDDLNRSKGIDCLESQIYEVLDDGVYSKAGVITVEIPDQEIIAKLNNTSSVSAKLV